EEGGVDRLFCRSCVVPNSVRKRRNEYERLQDFSGKQTRELLGERDLSMTEATAVIALGIGKPDLRYQQFPYDQVQQALTQLGVPPKGAAMYIEMYKAINAGVLVPLETRMQENTTPTSFEQFVQEVFAPAYHGKAQSV